MDFGTGRMKCRFSVWKLKMFTLTPRSEALPVDQVAWTGQEHQRAEGTLQPGPDMDPCWVDMSCFQAQIH